MEPCVRCGQHFKMEENHAHACGQHVNLDGSPGVYKEQRMVDPLTGAVTKVWMWSCCGVQVCTYSSACLCFASFLCLSSLYYSLPPPSLSLAITHILTISLFFLLSLHLTLLPLPTYLPITINTGTECTLLSTLAPPMQGDNVTNQRHGKPENENRKYRRDGPDGDRYLHIPRRGL